MRSIRISLHVTFIILLLAFFTAPAPTAGQGQDQTFRLLNIERRLDQLQTRVDFLERIQQSLQSQSQGNANSNTATAAVLELQRQQLYLAEQVLTMQRQMLEMQKKIDRLTPPPTPAVQEKKEKPEEKPKPKPTGKP